MGSYRFEDPGVDVKLILIGKNVKVSRNRLGVDQRFPGGLGPQIFHDFRHMKVVRSSAPRTGRLYPQECS